MKKVSRSRMVPALYPALALVLAALLLPSALRPPPEQTNDSAALNPNAPPDDQAEQVIQAFEQAKGGGAGAAEGEPATTIPIKRANASGRCIAGRQTESVYSAPCAPAFTGSNGGSTSKNVFPNEIRWGFWHVLGTPAEGKVNDDAAPGESANMRTFRVLEEYFNKRFQTYGRHVSFYGLTGSTDPAADQAEAKKAGEQFRLFGAYHLNMSFCEPFARETGPVWCNPQRNDVYKRLRPNMWSFMIDRTAAAGFGAEFVCKKLMGPGKEKAKFSGTETNSDRKISVITEDAPGGGQIKPADYQQALQKECGARYTGNTYQLPDNNNAAAASAAVVQMRQQGTTSVILELGLLNTLYLMSAADAAGWQPEWILVNAYGVDFNTIGTLLPQNQSAHLFGLSAWETPRRFEESECYQAYREIDPDNEPDSTDCGVFWHPMVLLMSGIQEAGPNLTPESFQKGLYKLGYRFPPEPWAIGGGFSDGDWTYMDNVGEVWYSLSAVNPENSAPGAYVWSYGARRFKRGELPTDDGQLFHHGVTTPGGAEINR